MSKKRIFIYLGIIVLSGIITIGLNQLLDMDSNLMVAGVPVMMACILFGSATFKKD